MIKQIRLAVSYTFLNGSKGYIGFLGEWKAVTTNISQISTLMKLIGGTTPGTSSSSNRYWTSTLSTEYNSSDSWEVWIVAQCALGRHAASDESYYVGPFTTYQ